MFLFNFLHIFFHDLSSLLELEVIIILSVSLLVWILVIQNLLLGCFYFQLKLPYLIYGFIVSDMRADVLKQPDMFSLKTHSKFTY